MANFDIERLGLDEGEEILPGIVLQADGGMTGQFRILCDGQHGEGAEQVEEEVVDGGAVVMVVEEVVVEGSVVVVMESVSSLERALSVPSDAYAVTAKA